MSNTKREKGDRVHVVLLTIALFASLFVHFIFNVPLGFAFLIFFVGWPVGGTLVTIDDDLKGGWSNPDGSVRPPWLEAPFWGQVAEGVALSLVGFAVDSGWRSRDGVRFWFLAGAAACLAVALTTRKWWLLFGAAVGVAALWV